MAIRLVVDLNRQAPFKKAIQILDVAGKQRLTLKGLSGYDLRGLVGQRGLLRKFYPSNTPGEYLAVLRMYFSAVRSLFRKQWDSPEQYIIATNRGVSALLKLLKSILKTHDGPATYDVLKRYLEPLKSRAVTWDFTKLQKKYVGSQGWKEFHRDLVKVIRKKYPLFKE